MFLVVFLKSACPSLELAFCGSSTVVVCIGLRPGFWFVCLSPFEFSVLFRALPAITTATINNLERLFVWLTWSWALWIEVYASSGDLVLMSGMTPSHVHAGTASADHLRHVENGSPVERLG
jgi:hypothetical protein